MRLLRTTLFTFAILAFIFLMTVGLVIIASDHHSYRCPFMSDQHSICQMDFLDFISAWENTFLTNIPNLILFFGLSLSIILFKKIIDWFGLLKFLLLNGKLMREIKRLLTRKIFSVYLISPRAP